MSSHTGLILVAGASGLLGSRVAGKLLDRKIPVRALTRTPARIAELEGRGAIVAHGDLLLPDTLIRACEGVSQIFSTANSFLGVTPHGPKEVDVPGYRNLLTAARQAGVQRIVHTSAHGISHTRVDFFQAKMEVDALIRESAMPWVLLRPSAFLDVWVNIALEQAAKGRVVVFGNGRNKSNYVAVEDVARIAVRVLESPGIGNEEIDIGGPSTLSQQELLGLIERQFGITIQRRMIPRPMLRIGSVMMRRGNELAARFMAMGYWAASADRSLPHWKHTAHRFGIEPMTAEEYLAGLRKEAA